MAEVQATAILTIASIIACVVVAMAFLSLAPRLYSSIDVSGDEAVGRIKTDIKVIFAALNTSDTQHRTLLVWVKNVGSTDIFVGDSLNIFIWNSTYNFVPTYNSTPGWTYRILNDGGNRRWDPHETMELTVTSSNSFAGEYAINIVTPNGVSHKYEFSV